MRLNNGLMIPQIGVGTWTLRGAMTINDQIKMIRESTRNT